MKNAFLCFLAFFTLTAVTATPNRAENPIDAEVDLGFTGCKRLPSKNKNEFIYEKTCLESWLNQHPFFTTAFQPWQESISKPIVDRVVPAEGAILEFLMVDDLLFGGKAKGIRGVSNPEAVRMAQEALNQLPASLQRIVTEHFYGFILVEGVSYTGFAPAIEAVEGSKLKRGGIIVINLTNLINRNTGNWLSLNEWMTFREKTTYQEFDGNRASNVHDVTLTLNKGDGSSTINDMFKWFLIHEMGHVVAAVNPSIHPPFRYKSTEAPISVYREISPHDPLKAFPFLDTSWQKVLVNNGSQTNVRLDRKTTPTIEAILKNKPVRFYNAHFDKKYTIEEASQILNELNETCFVSLYALVDYTEDFAETMTQYFLRKDGYQPFSTTLIHKKSGQDLAKFKNQIWDKPECQGKIHYIQENFD